eukprot:TRINITY_DN1370_c0_g1_i14.p2 TRINITY_DN1370_c0_g1~~TRINITY_DN1370_c0_g1_i14.p2  ORF type:complete len:459 (-),score=72.06 TRINITY_DN1370_c0_g1_i14:984-2177(-)
MTGLQAHTCAAAFGLFDREGARSNSLLTRSHRFVVVDEAFMVSQHDWAEIYQQLLMCPDARLILAGDLGQLAPVNATPIGESGSFLDAIARIRVKLTVNHRLASDDPETRRFGELCDRLHGGLPLPDGALPVGHHQRSLCYTNRVRAEVNKMWNARLGNGAPLFVGQKWIAEDTKKGQYTNGRRYTLTALSPSTATLTPERGAVEIDVPNSVLLRHIADPDDKKPPFALAFCTTVHKAQGATIRQPYTIYESETKLAREEPGWLYTAVTRATRLADVCVADWREVVGTNAARRDGPIAVGQSRLGYIYAARAADGRIVYVGQTRCAADRWAQHAAAESECAFHRAIRAGLAVTFEVLESGEFDDAELTRREQMYIGRHGTRGSGYNERNAAALYDGA